MVNTTVNFGNTEAMSDYKTELTNLVERQIEEFVAKVIKDEYTVDNGVPPSGNADGTGRIGQLMNLDNPRYETSSSKDGTSKLYVTENDIGSYVLVNNNPKYPSNIVNRLNTPFDHVERILLQDFSDIMGISGDGNYFKSLFTFSKNGNGVSKIELNGENYQSIDEIGKGPFMIDSFTYTPFIDYSQTEYETGWMETARAKTGVYSDEFLNDYNCGRYEQSYGNGGKIQYDGFHRPLSTNLFTLRNLDKDLYDAKIAFRDAITYVNEDGSQKGYQTYIYTFCEHLAGLFAKLSNIRMSHEIYGFKHPHHEWEGILALDIWYQMLYRQIDAKYPFDETFMNMNPMSRREISEGKVEWNGKHLGREGIEALGLYWIEDPSAPGYAYIWNREMFERFDANACTI